MEAGRVPDAVVGKEPDRAWASSVRWARSLCTIASLAFLAFGCASARLRDDKATPDELAYRRELSRAAQSAVDQQDWHAAENALEQLVAAAPRSAEAHQRLARVLQAQDLLDRAQAHFQAALRIDADYPAALVGLGQVETQQGFLRAALGHLEEAIELDPRRAEAHLARAQALEAFGRTDDALPSYFRAVDLDPASSVAMIRIAALQLNKDRPEQALARLEQAIELAPDNSEALHQRGRAYLALGQIDSALSDLRLAAKRLPNRPDVYYDLALALERGNQKGDALQAAQQAVRLAPQHAAAGQLLERLRR